MILLVHIGTPLRFEGSGERKRFIGFIEFIGFVGFVVLFMAAGIEPSTRLFFHYPMNPINAMNLIPLEPSIYCISEIMSYNGSIIERAIKPKIPPRTMMDRGSRALIMVSTFRLTSLS